ncbi:hypothetical protein [Nonomuraea harbinensis]|uniref:DUF222 domain-containing protein n=1 Tax=Nonomuraea harbinensis TaxID=1286938 RepID=A0ABW1BL16_9ACTN|nr:hypothetical protein [Nonomuraea harbinensis]
MLGMQLNDLVGGLPDGLAEALELVDGFDDALSHGFGRVGEQRAAAIAALAGAVAATPLGDRVAEAAAKVPAGSVSGEHLTALAAARSALLGAAHDALLTRLDESLGRTRSPSGPPATGDSSVPGNLLVGCRSWLYELAITGWRGVGHDLAAAGDQAIEAVLAEPGARRLAVLLDGLAAELRDSSPVSTMERLPLRRWADLWTRATLLAEPGWPGSGEGAETVSGRLLPLGADVHEHGTAVQVQVHAVLEPAGGGTSRLVRVSVAAGKVDTITGPAVWGLFQAYPVLLATLAKHLAAEIDGMPLLPGGDLVWQEEKATAAELTDPFATARVLLAGAVAGETPPLDRHPARVAEPVLVEGYKAAKAGGGVTLTLDGATLPFATGRLPGCGPLTPELLAASTACVGLLRWDAGGWLLQPLAVQATVKKKPVAAHNGDWALGTTDPKAAKALAKTGDPVGVLRERAGRLLRK